MSVCIPLAFLVPQKLEEGIRFPGTGVTNDCEPSCGSWEQNSGSLQEQKVLIPTEPSLQPLIRFFFYLKTSSWEEFMRTDSTEHFHVGRKTVQTVS